LTTGNRQQGFRDCKIVLDRNLPCWYELTAFGLLKNPIDSIVLISMQNDGHRGSIVFHHRGNPLMSADREATDIGYVPPDAGRFFTIFPIAKSTQVHKKYSMVAPDRSWGLEV
jgi:hypothetical protein